MESIAGTDPEVMKTSGASNDDVLSQNNHLLIAVSSSSSSTLISDRSSEPGNETSYEQTGTLEIAANKSTSEEIEEMPKLIETSEPEKSRKNVKFNLRKSLAWDSAFFTSDGVLDADELSTMIGGGEKGVKHCLPGIEEEVYRSMESISTLESDNLSLECLEAELFQDIRASIQNSNKSTNLNDSSIKLSSGKIDSQPNVSSSSKKADLDSAKRLGAKTKNKTSSIPQPKVVSRVNLNLNSTSALTKRASLSANHAKKDQDTAKQARVTQKGSLAAKTTTQVLKVTGLNGPQRGVRKALLSSKSSSLGTSTALKTDPIRPSSSCSNSSSCSSGRDVKVRSSTNLIRKKVDTKTGKITTTTSIIPQTRSRINMKNKPPVSSSLSSSISPASSISEWSMQSSASTSTIDRNFTPRGSIDSSVQSDRKGNQSVAVHPSKISSVSRPPAVPPTGLRMPSPKIGFFDGGKSTLKGGVRSQSKLPTGVPKPGATRVSQTSSNAVKLGKIPPPKTSAVASNMKQNPLKASKSSQQNAAKPETKTCPVPSDTSDHKSESSLNLCVNPSNLDSDSNKQSDLGNNGYEVLSSECIVVKDDKMDASDHKSESSLNLCLNPSNLDIDSNKQTDLGNNDYEVLSSECIVVKDDKMDASDHKSESSLNLCVNPSNLDSDSSKRADLGNKGCEVLSNECVAMKDDIMDKFKITDGSRTPFAVKNSVSDTDKEVTEKTNLSFIDSQQNENSEVV